MMTNVSAMSALHVLQRLDRSMGEASQRVATGLKVRSAADDAITWRIASTARAESETLGVVQDALARGEARMTGIDARLDGARAALERVRDLLVAARQSDADRGAIEAEVRAVMDQLWRSAFDGARSSPVTRPAPGDGGETKAPQTPPPEETPPASGGPPDHPGKGRGPRNEGPPQGRPFEADSVPGKGPQDNPGKGGPPWASAASASAPRGGGPSGGAAPEAAPATPEGRSAAQTPSSPEVTDVRQPDSFLGVPVAGRDVEILAGAPPIGATPQVPTMTLKADGEALFRAVGEAYARISTAPLQALDGSDGQERLDALVAVADRALRETAVAQGRVGMMLSRIESRSELVGALAGVKERIANDLQSADVESEAARLKALQSQHSLAVEVLAIAQETSAAVLRIFR